MKKPMKKVKRYSGEDGESEVIDMRSDTSQPTGIDDSVRARARRFMETGEKDDEMKSSKPKARAKPKVMASKSEAKEEPKNFRVPEEKGLERVTPELDLLPIGKVAGALGAGYLGARAIGKRMLAKRAADAHETMAEKAYLTARNAKLADKSEKALSSGAMKGDFRPEELSGGFKKGGAVKRSSASSRGDGCVTKGHTRGTVVACGGGMMRGKK